MNFTRTLFFLLLWAIAIQGKAQKTSSTIPDTLDNPARLRPNDILKNDIRWNTASTDLFTYWLDAGLYGFYGSQPTIMLNGMPVDINYFGWQNLNMLPVNVEEVTQTTSRFTPQVYQNHLSNAGLIDLATVTPDSGLSFRSSFYIGNESGDPGPYIFDSLKTTPNIDRWGPDGSLSLSYHKDNWYAKGAFSFRNHQQTDLISNQRIHITASVLGTNQDYVNYKIQTTTKSGLLQTGYNGSNLKLKARALYGKGRDYLFLQPFGREIPVENAYKQFAVQGDYNLGRWLFINRYMFHNKTMGKRYDLHTYIFDWDQTSHTVSTSAKYIGTALSIMPGIIYERLKTKAPGVTEPYNDLVTFYLESQVNLGSFTQLKLYGNADYDEKELAHTFKAGLPVQISENWKMSPEFFYSETLPLRQNSFPYWLTRGYNFGEELGIPSVTPFKSFKNELSGAKLTNRFFLSGHTTILFEQQYLRHHALNIPWQIVEEYEFLDTLPGPFTATKEEGSRFSLLAQITNKISHLVDQRFSILLQRTVSGTERYKSYWKQIPATKVSYDLDIQPVNDLMLSLNATYRSSTHWEEYADLEGASYKLPSGIPIRPYSGTFHTATPSFTNITIGLQKRFWDGRLNTQFSIQNLLNQEVRMHTMGAELFTKFNVKVGLKF